MTIISPVKAFACALALVSPKRPPELVGSVGIRYNTYNDGYTEYCMEEHTELGWTWVHDKHLFMREVPIENCYPPEGY